ncbi:hypothetical protein NFI96_015155 [Prochilodus magdalenae]|nr:hypothetical protein NFI96_015155 [Prochilodus magdalenae]
MYSCRITEEGCAALASALKSNPSHLRELDLRFSNPGLSGVKLLSDLLKDPHCKLEKLEAMCFPPDPISCLPVTAPPVSIKLLTCGDESMYSPTPTPTLIMGNVRSLANKMDELTALAMSQKEYRQCSLMCYLETWLHQDIPDDNVSITCPDIELLAVGLRPYYLPREFSHVVVVAVYIPPSANPTSACDVTHSTIVRLQTQHPTAFIAISGDFNHVTIARTLSNFTQYVDCPTREERTLDLLYANVKDAYSCSALWVDLIITWSTLAQNLTLQALISPSLTPLLPGLNSPLHSPLPLLIASPPFCDSPLHTSSFPPPVTSTVNLAADQVRRQLQRLHMNKALGPDGVPPRVLKACATQLCGVLQHVFNMSLCLQRVPVMWKMSCIVPVPKTPRPSDIKDYRPVALTSHIMKTMERLVLEQLRPMVQPLLDPLQFAYQPRLGVEDAIIYLLNRVYAHLDKPASTVRVMFFDFSGAFNTIQPALLGDKLNVMQVDAPLVSWIVDYLTGRPQYVRLQHCVSDRVVSNTGAPQGTVLSPFLFTLYTTDFNYCTETCHLQKFSDDSAVVGCISRGDEDEYRATVNDFVACLSHCRITEEGCAALVSALKSNPSHLRELDLSWNNPGKSGVKLLSDLLEDPHCKLEKLHPLVTCPGVWQSLLACLVRDSVVSLFNCRITEEGCAALVSALKLNPSHLRELKLSWNNPGESGVKLLSDLLEDPHCKLETLQDTLSSSLTPPTPSLGAPNLSSRFITVSPSLSSLPVTLAPRSLYSCSITEEGCAALASALKLNPSHLRELDLRYNKPGESGVKLLSDLLEDPHCKLEKLYFYCSITNDGFAALVSVLTSTPLHLMKLNLNSNMPGQSGVLSDLLEDPHCKLEKLQ